MDGYRQVPRLRQSLLYFPPIARKSRLSCQEIFPEFLADKNEPLDYLRGRQRLGGTSCMDWHASHRCDNCNSLICVLLGYHCLSDLQELQMSVPPDPDATCTLGPKESCANSNIGGVSTAPVQKSVRRESKGARSSGKTQWQRRCQFSHDRKLTYSYEDRSPSL